jgi:cathepsin B
VTSGGSINVVLSPEDMVACDKTNFGCNGGNLATEWAFLERNGICTDACLPYTSGGGKTAPCTTTCADGSTKKRYSCIKDSTVKATTVAGIQSEI